MSSSHADFLTDRPGADAFANTGWLRLGPDPTLLAWATATCPPALQAVAGSPDPWRCGSTWFAGVDTLPNDVAGAVPGGRPLPWQILPLLPGPLHAAQISVVRHGYPQPSKGETDAAFRYRLSRDAAHVDGLLPVGHTRRRMIREPHAWILGLPLTEAGPDAAPLVVWEGSHNLMRAAFHTALSPHPPAAWCDIDLTDAYHAARSAAFATCRRVELPASPGQALILHRLTLHGTARWTSTDATDRVIAFFRPVLSQPEDWLALP
jgi:hypothetical protein